MIRFYEKKDLIHPARSANNYRDYSIHDLHILILIKQYNSLGLSLSVIHDMLSTNDSEDLSVQLNKQIEQLHNDAIWAYARFRNAADLQVVLDSYKSGKNMDTGIRPVQYYLRRQTAKENAYSLSYVNNGIARPVYHVSVSYLTEETYPEDSGLLFTESHPLDDNTYIEIPSHHFYRTICLVDSNTLISTSKLQEIITEMHRLGYQEMNDIYIYQLLGNTNSSGVDIICVEITIQ